MYSKKIGKLAFQFQVSLTVWMHVATIHRFSTHIFAFRLVWLVCGYPTNSISDQGQQFFNIQQRGGGAIFEKVRKSWKSKEGACS